MAASEVISGTLTVRGCVSRADFAAAKEAFRQADKIARLFPHGSVVSPEFTDVEHLELVMEGFCWGRLTSGRWFVLKDKQFELVDTREDVFLYNLITETDVQRVKNLRDEILKQIPEGPTKQDALRQIKEIRNGG